MNDVVSRSLDVEIFQDDATFENIQFVDFYRYCDVSLGEVLDFLDKRAPWIRPADTGRSTNCLINEVGIYIHKKERGYHNYALPYSWDVRLGHKTREAAVEELDDEINVNNVKRILNEIGYDENYKLKNRTERRLAAYYVSNRHFTVSDLRAYLSQKLPNYMIPSYFVAVDEIPLTPNGKVDRKALPSPGETRPELEENYVEPRNPIEGNLVAIWGKALNINQVGIHDNFVELGGNSLAAVQVIAQVHQVFQVELPLRSPFDAPTIAELAEVVEEILIMEIENLNEDEAQRLADSIE